MVLAPLAMPWGPQRPGRDDQSAAGAGSAAMKRLREEAVEDHDLRMDWDFDGVELDEEARSGPRRRRSSSCPICR